MCTHRTAFSARAQGRSAKNPKLTHTLGNTNTLTHRMQPWFNPRDFVSSNSDCVVWFGASLCYYSVASRAQKLRVLAP
jgi:hypothetical protein